MMGNYIMVLSWRKITLFRSSKEWLFDNLRQGYKVLSGISWWAVAKQRVRGKTVSANLHSLRAPLLAPVSVLEAFSPDRSSWTSTQISFSERLAVFQSAVCVVPWGWQPAKDCLFDCYGPMGPRSWAPEPGNQGCPLGGSCKNQGTGWYKSSLLGDTDSLEFAEGERQDGTAASLPSGECSSRFLDVCVRLDACPSGQCFITGKWASFPWSLSTRGFLWSGPRAGWVPVCELFSQVITALWVLWTRVPLVFRS